jgi:virginiamycin B lyase
MRHFMPRLRLLIFAGLACVAIALALHARPSSALPFFLPTDFVRSHDMRVATPQVGAQFGKYFGQTMTLPGTWSSAISVAYDSDTARFYVLVGGSFQTGAQLYRVTPSGNAYLLTSQLDSSSADIAYDPATKLLYGTGTYDVYAVSPQSGLATVIAGGTYGTSDGQGSAAQFQQPQGIAVDPSTGIIYVADYDRIRAVTPAGDVTTLTAPGSIGPLNGNYVNAPEGLTFDVSNATLYVGDPFRQSIQSVTLSGTVATAAGQCILLLNSNICASLQRDGPAADAFFDEPSGVAYDPVDGSIEIADLGNQQVRRFYQGSVTTVAGNGHTGAGDGIGNEISFNGLRAMAVDGHSGNLWVVDTGNGLLRLVSLSGASPPPPPHGTVLYYPPTVSSGVSGVAALADDSIWFTENAANQIGEITSTGSMVEYKLPGHAVSPQRIAAGSDGNMWFADELDVNGNDEPAIGRITPMGKISEFTLFTHSSFPGVPADVALGPDGNIWFLNGTDIGDITPAGVIHQYPSGQGVRLTGGYDGAIWNSLLTSQTTGVIDRYAVTGQFLSQYAFTGYMAGALAKGPEDHVWFSQPDAVGYATKSGLVEFLLPFCNYCSHQVSDIVGGSDNAVWFAESGYGYIGRMTPLAYYSQYIIGAPRSAPTAITMAPNGTIWFVDPGADRVGRAY